MSESSRFYNALNRVVLSDKTTKETKTDRSDLSKVDGRSGTSTMPSGDYLGRLIPTLTLYSSAIFTQRIHATCWRSHVFSLIDEKVGRPMAIPSTRARLPVRLWNSYLSALQVRPIRTRVITSSVLFFTGDLIAQAVIEDRKLLEPEQGLQRGWDVSHVHRLGHHVAQMMR